MSTIFHITTSDNWLKAKAQGEYDFCALATDGFIHASKWEQTLKTANKYFENQTDLVVLVIEAEKLTSQLVFEAPAGRDEEFPHIYGPLNLDAVIGFKKLVTNEEGQFTEIVD